MKVKLIDVLVMMCENKLQNDDRVIIDDALYYYNNNEKRFYTVPSNKGQQEYRNIRTDSLDLNCELLDVHNKIEEAKDE